MTQQTSQSEPKYEMKLYKHNREVMHDPRTDNWMHFLRHMCVHGKGYHTAGNKYFLLLSVFEMCRQGIVQTPDNLCDYVNSKVGKDWRKSSKVSITDTMSYWCGLGCVTKYIILRKDKQGKQVAYVPNLDGLAKYWFGCDEKKTDRPKFFYE